MNPYDAGDVSRFRRERFNYARTPRRDAGLNQGVAYLATQCPIEVTLAPTATVRYNCQLRVGHAGPHLIGVGRTFEQIGADRLADEVAALVRRGVLQTRTPVTDALEDYRLPPSSPRADRLAELESRLSTQQKEIAQLTNDVVTLQRLYDDVRDTENVLFGIPDRPMGSAVQVARWLIGKRTVKP